MTTVIQGVSVNFTLPYPPSVNHLYGRHGNRTFIKKEGVAFYSKCAEIIGEVETLPPPYKLTAVFFMPDRRKRDGGNLLKAVEDALTKSGVITDDKDIEQWDLRKSREVFKEGKVEVTIKTI